MIRIGVLTSSRADFGIYLPLLNQLSNEDDFAVKIIAFGTHLSPYHGYTLTQIEEAGFKVQHQIESLLLTDSPESIATSIGLTVIKFSEFWKSHGHDFDLIFCLGDRFEMFAAVTASIPFQLPIAHIHGGETTLGAIDNVFRHCITLSSKYHFVSTEVYAHKVEQITGSDNHVYHVGALSLDNLDNLKLLTIKEFQEKWNIDLSKKTILITFHPETVAYKANEFYTDELIKTIDHLTSYQVLITMPNADTAGNYIRQAFINKYGLSDRVLMVENLGSAGYFTAMKYCSMLIGNTSSGIIEAASFQKHVINLGNRQQGRLCSNNVKNVAITYSDIVEAVHEVENTDTLSIENIYFNGGAADKIISILRKNFPLQ